MGTQPPSAAAWLSPTPSACAFTCAATQPDPGLQYRQNGPPTSRSCLGHRPGLMAQDELSAGPALHGTRGLAMETGAGGAEGPAAGALRAVPPLPGQALRLC